MAVSPWLRLWLPLGNTFLLVAVLETVFMIRNELKDIGIFLYQTVDMSAIYNMTEITFLTVLMGVRVVATIGLLWFGTIIKGNKTSLLIWILTTVILSIGGSIFLLVYTLNLPHEIDKMYIWSNVYTFLIVMIMNVYTIYVAIATYKALVRQETLHPIGKGIYFIWEYFSNETKIAATFFLTSEIVLDADYLMTKQFMQFFGIQLHGHDGDSYPPIIIEEIVMRVIRILVNLIGIWLVVKEKRRLFRWWCAFTFLLIIVSTCIFIILTVMWRGEDISATLAYFLMFPGHLLYRFITLYFCLKYTRADFGSFVL